jgi:hypothetical protein
MLDVDFGFFGCLSLSFEFWLPHPHPHPKLNFFWVPVSGHHLNDFLNPFIKSPEENFENILHWMSVQSDDTHF